jgi:hypothetical protein
MATYAESGDVCAAAKSARLSLATHYRLLETSELRAWLADRYREHSVVEHSGAITLSAEEASSARETLARLIPIKRERVQ